MTEKTLRSTPKLVKHKKVLRSEIKFRSPKSPKSPHSSKRKSKVLTQQHHLVSKQVNSPNKVSKLIRTFESNSAESVEICKNIEGENDLNCIREGSVKNAFELLMTRRRNGVDTLSKTPRRKYVKRLESGKTTPKQKRIEDWVSK